MKIKDNEWKTMEGFRYRCICNWSLDNKHGFIPNTECLVHGKQAKKMLSKGIPIK